MTRPRSDLPRMQKRGSNGRIVELEVSKNRRHLDRVGKIRIARGAPLLAVGLHGVNIGTVEQRLVGLGIVALDPLDQVILPHHAWRLFRLLRLFMNL